MLESKLGLGWASRVPPPRGRQERVEGLPGWGQAGFRVRVRVRAGARVRVRVRVAAVALAEGSRLSFLVGGAVAPAKSMPRALASSAVTWLGLGLGLGLGFGFGLLRARVGVRTRLLFRFGARARSRVRGVHVGDGVVLRRKHMLGVITR